MLKLLPFILVTLATTPALAGATPWQEIAPGTRARLISSDTVTAGKTLVGIELDMPADTKTYWRIPGETGIPTQFDFTGTSGVSAPTVLWPYPELDTADGFRNYVYHGHVVLPVQLDTAGGAATLDANVTLGVCSDICVPAQAKFSLPLRLGAGDAEQSLRLEQAVAETPIGWDQPEPPFGAVTAVPGGLAIADLDPAVDPASFIADVGDPTVLFGAPQKSPDGTSWVLKLLEESAAQGLEGRPVSLTFKTASGPYAVSRQVAAAH
jgi:DsbC/DsbD-like thiol-disulfide interchange protein